MQADSGSHSRREQGPSLHLSVGEVRQYRCLYFNLCFLTYKKSTFTLIKIPIIQVSTYRRSSTSNKTCQTFSYEGFDLLFHRCAYKTLFHKYSPLQSTLSQVLIETGPDHLGAREFVGVGVKAFALRGCCISV